MTRLTVGLELEFEATREEANLPLNRVAANAAWPKRVIWFLVKPRWELVLI